ncbi:unnamed protein product [Amoebophrya sp. A25]|nr:unnamed protein product [Amoebophrya sp. A25]|eukprot:GSA25T00004439001.1
MMSLSHSIVPASALPAAVLPGDTKNEEVYHHFQLTQNSVSVTGSTKHLVFVVDVSASMDTAVAAVAESGKSEYHGFSILDLVKHSLLTITSSLDSTQGYEVSLVTFSRQSATVFTRLRMHVPEEKARAERLILALESDATTNLWAGLQRAMDLVRVTALNPFNDRNNTRDGDETGDQDSVAATTAPVSDAGESGEPESSAPFLAGGEQLSATYLLETEVLLFTDGLPNVNPPKGHVNTMLKYQTEKKIPSFTLRTFGFGYSLDSKLLEELATAGGGSFSFIPDGSFVGTVFIHALASIRSVVPGCPGSFLRVKVEMMDEDADHGGNSDSSAVQIQVVGHRDNALLSNSGNTSSYRNTDGKRVLTKSIPVGATLECGQPRDFIVRVLSTQMKQEGGAPVPANAMQVTAEYVRPNLSLDLGGESATIVLSILPQDQEQNDDATKKMKVVSLLGQLLRLETVSLLHKIVSRGLPPFAEEGKGFNPYTRSPSASSSVGKDELAESLKAVADFAEKWIAYLEKAKSEEEHQEQISKADELDHDQERLLQDTTGTTASSSSSSSASSLVTAMLRPLLDDLTGQVTEAVSRQDWYEKWGAFYLRSLRFAHLLQRRNNFKDPGVQIYGSKSEFFENEAERIADLFMSLAPPKPSRRGYIRSGGGGGSSAAGARVSMRAYNNSHGPCFTGDALVHMADGSLLRCDQIVKNNVILSARTHVLMRVKCVIKTVGPDMRVVRLTKAAIQKSIHATSMNITLVEDEQNNYCNANDCQVQKEEETSSSNPPYNTANDYDTLGVTPYHPLQTANNGWVFPAEIAVQHPEDSKLEVADAVYNFLLEPVRSVGSLHDKGEDHDLQVDVLLSSTSTAADETSQGVAEEEHQDYSRDFREDHTIVVNGVSTCTLGHGITSDAVLSHPYFGNYKRVKADLAAMTGFSDKGLVVLDSETCCVKDAKTGLVCKLIGK